jgi:hypothetical protein
MQPTIHEPAREIPVLGAYDVVVCGGGAAGCAAAIAAARHGAKCLLVEKDGYLGGATVSQLVGHILSTNGADFQGVWHEWIRAVHARGGLAGGRLQATPGQIRGGVDPEVVKFAWDDLLEAAGVEQVLHSYCSTAIVEEGVCRGIVADTRAGRRAILGKRVIDCTADGVVCAAAGVPWEQGDGEHLWSQALTRVFRMGNVHWPADGYSPEAVQAARQALADAVARGEYDSPVVVNGRVITYGTGHWVHQSVAHYRTEHNEFPSRVLQVNPLDPFDMTRAEREGREQAWQSADFLRRYVKGYEEAYLLDTNAHIGLRDSRRIQGLATATAEDAWTLGKYPDGIARCSWEIDTWPADSYEAAAVPHGREDYEARKARVMQGDWFDIRYGCLIAAGIDNLLVAGRCLSAEREAQAALRIQQTCQATGQAAGVAAVLSLQANTTPRELDPAVVVAQLAQDRDVEPVRVEAHG